MLGDLASSTGAQAWAIGSLLFFLIVFLAVVFHTMTGKDDHHQRCARLPLDELAPSHPTDHEVSHGAV